MCSGCKQKKRTINIQQKKSFVRFVDFAISFSESFYSISPLMENFSLQCGGKIDMLVAGAGAYS